MIQQKSSVRLLTFDSVAGFLADIAMHACDAMLASQQRFGCARHPASAKGLNQPDVVGSHETRRPPSALPSAAGRVAFAPMLKGWVSDSHAREAVMLDWLTWPADLLLNAGGVVAGWFVSKDTTSFTVIQMGFGTLVLAAVVSAIVFWQSLVEFWRSRWRSHG
ncbi:MAG: hypothetical protein WBE71_17850 [Xanthobacteraceae bacterium]